MGRASSEDFVKLTGYKFSSQYDANSLQGFNGRCEDSAFHTNQDVIAIERDDHGLSEIDNTQRTEASKLGKNTDKREDSKYEQFQLIWQDLSFQVSQSALERTASKFREIMSRKLSDQKKIYGRRGNTVRQEAGSRYVFRNVNGYIRSGEIAAILGPSGAGKTSLLKAICGLETRNYQGSIKLVGGRHKKRMQVSSIPQKDYLNENLTVRENLSYSSRILNVNKNFDHEANIDRVVLVLNLMKCIDTLCINLSGGEYKRVSIAQELLRQPDVLVLDEPTSGLDSLNCKKLISALRDLIETSLDGKIAPIAIVMTIHQPDIEIYSMFDHVYCLAPGGRVVFDGHPSETLDVLKTQGGIHERFGHETDEKPYEEQVPLINPANKLIEIASKVSYDDATIDRLADYHRERLQRYWTSVEVSRSGIDIEISNHVDSQPYNRLFRDKRLNLNSHKNKGRFWYHTWLLTKRTFFGSIRDPMISVSSLLVYLTLPIVMWSIFSSEIGTANACPRIVRNISMFAMVDDGTQTQLADEFAVFMDAFECSAMFFVTTYSFALCCAVISALTFPLNMHILLKEIRNGWYGMSSFVWAKTLANFPVEIIFPSMSLVLVYIIFGMPSSYMEWRMIALAMVMALVAMVATTQGLVFGALFMDDSQAATFFSVMVGISGSILSGFTARISNMPSALRLASWFNPLRYSAELISILRYGHGICKCESETEEYMKANRPQITDLPDGMGAAMRFFLNTEKDSINEDVIETAPTTTTTVMTLVSESRLHHVPGINYNFAPNKTRDDKIRGLINSGQLDFMDEFAKLFANSLSYGQDFNDCKSVRSQNMAYFGMLEDDWLPWLFAMLVGLLVFWKIVLYLIVRIKIVRRL